MSVADKKSVADTSSFEEVPFDVRKVNAGFRLDVVDIVFVATCAIVTAVVYRFDHYLALLVGQAPCVFFLYCNVFRVKRRLEKIWWQTWAVLIVPLVLAVSGYLFVSAHTAMVIAFSIQSLSALLLIICNFQMSGYHGVLWEKINPTLDGYIPRAVTEYHANINRRIREG
jgi:hypothetical protein